MKIEGKTPSLRERLIRVVIGSAKVSMQDFSNEVGIESSSHVEFDDDRMICLTSVTVAGTNSWSDSGGKGGGWCTEEETEEGKDEDNLVILSWKKFKNDSARLEAELKVGNDGGKVRDKSEFKTGHNFFGLFEFLAISDL